MKQAMKVMVSSASEEWFTPAVYTDAAREVMGSIDLDPASNPVANKWIQATTYFTKDDDGLSKPWFGNVWLNPPRGMMGRRSSQGVWGEYLRAEWLAERVQQGLLLTRTVPGYDWWERLFESLPVCFLRERIAFLRLIDGKLVEGGCDKVGTTIWYFGHDVGQFERVYKKFGKVIW